MLKRLDVLLTEKNLVRSRRVGRDLIKEGNVKVNGQVVKKQGKRFKDSVTLDVSGQPKYVSRAGYKLEKALKEFKISPKDKVCLDVGTSTGGFTDCLLQFEAKKVYSVEVGTEQIRGEIKDDNRVISMENTDIRNVKKLPEKIDLAVIDVSFISLTEVLPTVKKFLKKNAEVIVLIKPQFEVKRAYRKKKGVVKDTEIRKKAVNKVKESARSLGFSIDRITDSPIQGAKGNKEFLSLLTIME